MHGGPLARTAKALPFPAEISVCIYPCASQMDIQREEKMRIAALNEEEVREAARAALMNKEQKAVSAKH